MSLPNGSNKINATPILPTSPAKHLALPLGRKLKKQKMRHAMAMTIR